MTDGRPGGRFERHPRLTGAGLFLLALVLLELGLRLAAPRALVFAHEMRRVHRYSRVARVDLRPSQSAHLRIDRSDGQPLFDFRLDVGPDGFRIESPAARRPAREASGPRVGAVRYVHAIGDSYTMGWGVNAADSYPARLERKLREAAAADAAGSTTSDRGERAAAGHGVAARLSVINLGVDGFGAIGATAKSRALADPYPPAVAVYLFSPNDLDDDVRAADVARRSGLVHAAHEALDALRRWSYVAGIPFALRYRLQFRTAAVTGEAAEARAAGDEPAGSARDPRAILLPDPAALPAPPRHHPSLTALSEYRDFLAERDARLMVLVLSNQPESLLAYRFCREQGIDVRLFDVAPTERIPDEGHFNARGNEAVASLVAELLRRP